MRWRLDLLALAVVAPALWALSDLVITGDPLYSLNATSALAEELGRERGIANVPGNFVAFLADTARPPVFAAALLGAVLAFRARARLHALHVPLALFAAGTATFVGTGIAGLSILPRYLTVPAVALCLLAGYAVLGFTTLPPGRTRTLWQRGAVGAALLGVAFLALKAGSFAALARELRFIERTHLAVVAAAQDPRVRQCRPVTLPTYRLIPDLRFELDAPEADVRARSELGADAPGTALFVVGDAGRNGVRAAFHHYVRAEVLPDRAAWPDRLVHLNSWEALGFDLDHDRAVDLDLRPDPRAPGVRRHDDRVSAAHGGGGRRIREQHEVGEVGEWERQAGGLGDGQPEQAGTPTDEVAGLRARAVAKRFGDRADVLTRGLGQPALPVQGVGDRGDRDARGIGDVLDADAVSWAGHPGSILEARDLTCKNALSTVAPADLGGGI